jgi:hypothetical protein
MGVQNLHSDEPATGRQLQGYGTSKCSHPFMKAHHIGAPDGEKKSEAQIGDEVIPSQPSIDSLFSLNVSQQRDQQIANTMIRSFDKRYIYRLLVEFIITSNNPFSIDDNIAFRKLMEYLNPVVRIRRAIPTGCHGQCYCTAAVTTVIPFWLCCSSTSPAINPLYPKGDDKPHDFHNRSTTRWTRGLLFP